MIKLSGTRWAGRETNLKVTRSEYNFFTGTFCSFVLPGRRWESIFKSEVCEFPLSSSELSGCSFKLKANDAAKPYTSQSPFDITRPYVCGSAVGIVATTHRLDGPKFESYSEEIFCSPDVSRRILPLTYPHIQ